MLSKFKTSDECLIIAEVGQNHQGDLELAREYIKVFAAEGADVIKFQTRNNKYLFSKEAYEAKYNSDNAFADFYGEHREKLELQKDWLPILKEDCIKNNVLFMSTPFDEPSFELLQDIGVDLIKVASFDLGNLPFLDKLASSHIPIVMSIGGGNEEQIQSSVDVITKYHQELAILHCVSEYPCEFNRLGLGNVKTLIGRFPDITIGSSDHFSGTLSGPIAYMQGARVFEKHVTLNRAWKGTDHSFALEPNGFKNFVRDIRRVNPMLPLKPSDDLGNEPVFKKLGKSLIASKDIKQNDEFTFDNLSGRIFSEQYVPVRKSGLFIGKKSNRDITAGEKLSLDDCC